MVRPKADSPNCKVRVLTPAILLAWSFPNNSSVDDKLRFLGHVYATSELVPALMRIIERRALRA